MKRWTVIANTDKKADLESGIEKKNKSRHTSVPENLFIG
jgi:hypothetical protein